ncbi:MAG: hypothetical protein GWN32_02385 [Gemmatimonadetes bacterium]|nr:hypothetical protein [Gemmatimonadota bacterium]
MTHRAIAVIAVFVALASLGAAQAHRQAHSKAIDDMTLGAEARLGEGTVSSFARFDGGRNPLAIGVVFSAEALASPPTARSDEHRCFDVDADGAIEPDTECLATHERVIPLPTEASRRADIPFKWVLLNWNPAGHIPPEIYGPPHFDIHFYIESIENTFALMPGPCGPEMLRCDQFERAVRPLPWNYMHPDFSNVDAAVPAMGNHLIDLTSPEFHGEVFTRTWIYGAYDGRVTFYEEMVTVDYLSTRPDVCYDIKAPAAVELAGHYPTKSCFRYDARTGEQTVSMEGFVYREASPPAPADE